MTRHEVTVEVLGPWSLATAKRFWEGFAPAPLPISGELRTAFPVDGDWTRAEFHVTQWGTEARIVVTGDGDLDRAAAQACRILALDVDGRRWPELAGAGRSWPEVADRDPVIADAQRRLPGLRPCGFHSPYEAAAWAVLSQRSRVTQAAGLRDDLVREHGAFPAPAVLRALELDLPGRKPEYLHAVAEAALEGHLDGERLRAMDPADALRSVREVKGLGPFAAELVVIRGANTQDVLPSHEHRLADEIGHRYGADREPAEVTDAWRPFRTCARCARCA